MTPLHKITEYANGSREPERVPVIAQRRAWKEDGVRAAQNTPRGQAHACYLGSGDSFPGAHIYKN